MVDVVEVDGVVDGVDGAVDGAVVTVVVVAADAVVVVVSAAIRLKMLPKVLVISSCKFLRDPEERLQAGTPQK